MKKVIGVGLVIFSILVITCLYEQTVEAETFYPSTVRRITLLILLNLAQAQGLDADLSREMTSGVDDLELRIEDIGLADELNGVVRDVDNAIRYFNVKAVIAKTDEILRTSTNPALRDFLEKGKRAIEYSLRGEFEKLASLLLERELEEGEEVEQVLGEIFDNDAYLKILTELNQGVDDFIEGTGVDRYEFTSAEDLTQAYLAQTWLMMPNYENAATIMRLTLNEFAPYWKDNEAALNYAHAGEGWTAKKLSTIAYWATMEMLLAMHDTGELRAHGLFTIVDVVEARYGEEFEKGDTPMRVLGRDNIRQFIEEYIDLCNTMIEKINVYYGTNYTTLDRIGAGRAASWANRVYSFLRDVNYDPAAGWLDNISFSTAKDSIFSLLDNASAIIGALESWGMEVGDIDVDRNQVYLDEWSTLALQLVAYADYEPEDAIDTLVNAIEGNIVNSEGEKLNLVAQIKDKLAEQLYKIPIDLFDLSDRGMSMIYRGWISNLFSLFNPEDILYSETEAEAADNIVKVIDSFSYQEGGEYVLLDSVAAYITNHDPARDALTTDWETGWMAGIATFWSKVHAHLTEKLGTEELGDPKQALDIVKKELNAREKIRQALMEITGWAGFLTERYWAPVMSRLEQLIDYSEGLSSRDQSIDTIVSAIYGFEWDPYTYTFEHLPDELDRLAEDIKGDGFKSLGEWLRDASKDEILSEYALAASTAYLPPDFGDEGSIGSASSGGGTGTSGGSPFNDVVPGIGTSPLSPLFDWF